MLCKTSAEVINLHMHTAGWDRDTDRLTGRVSLEITKGNVLGVGIVVCLAPAFRYDGPFSVSSRNTGKLQILQE